MFGILRSMLAIFSVKNLAVALCIVSFCFIFSGRAHAATYYVRADGTVTAASKASATSPASASTSLSMAQVNAATFAAGDSVLFSSQGGTYSTLLTIPSGGSGVGNEITYANVPNETPVIAVTTGNLINTNSKSNIIIQGFTYNYIGTSASTNIGLLLGAGSNITLRNLTSDMAGFGYNIWSSSILSNLTLDTISLTSCRSATLLCISLTNTTSNTNVNMNHVTVQSNIQVNAAVGLTINNTSLTNGNITVNTGSNVSISNISSVAAITLNTVTTGTLSNIAASGSITANTSSSINMSNITSVTGILLNSVTTGTLSNITASSGAGFDFANSSFITVNDSSMTNANDYGAFDLTSGSHDITYNRDTANDNGQDGFVQRDTSYNVVCDHCTADRNGAIGFLASISASNVTYRYSEASYNGTLNNTSDGGGFLPHDAATSVQCYYCIAHHNYNQGTGDVGTGTNDANYNTVTWNNGSALGDTFRGGTVSTPSARSNVYYRKAGGAFTVNNGIFGGGKPRELLNTGPSYTTLDYNLYKALDDNKFYNTVADSNNVSWTTYHATNEPHSNSADPLFINASGNYSLPTDFQLTYRSPAIDAGITTPNMTNTTTDYAGNPIYGAPDLGVYEYQPPHSIISDTIDVGAGARIYADGKFRDLSATSSVPAHLKIIPSTGSFTTYDAVTTRPAYLDITGITNWTNGHKTWTESNAQTSNMVTDHTVGDLDPNVSYTVSVTGATAANIVGINGTTCTNAVCQSDSSGTLSFEYTGGYSTHTFDLSENYPVVAPVLSTVGILSGGRLTPAPVALPVSTPVSLFTHTLRFGQNNLDVKKLQIFLNKDTETQVAYSGPGSPGHETNFFGPATKKAVIQFQEKYRKDILIPNGLVHGTGFVGTSTLAKLNALISS